MNPVEPDSAPQLIGPRLLPSASGIVALAILCVALLTLTGEVGRTVPTAPAGSSEDLLPAIATASAGGAFVPIDVEDGDRVNAAIAYLRLTEPDKRRVHDAVTTRRLRLAMTFLWDWADEDGDVGRVSSGEFTQDVPIRKAPQLVVVPFQAGAGSVVVSAIADGGGGITVALGTPAAPMRLRVLLPGESVQVGLP